MGLVGETGKKAKYYNSVTNRNFKRQYEIF